MTSTNFVSATVKILERPRQSLVNKIFPIVECRVQFPQIENDEIIHLIFWGSLGKDVTDYYKVNDYIIIEGYFSSYTNKLFQKVQKVQITVLKIYPLLLSSTDFISDQ